MLGGAAGLVIGAVAVAATRWSERSGAHAEPAEPPLPRGVGDVLSVLRSIAVVVDASDAVVNTSASAVSYGLVRHGELVAPRAAPPRPPGAPRRHDPRGRARPDPQPEHHGVRRDAGAGRADRGLARADPRRGPHPRPAGRGDPPRLRRQRQPRAEDPGRRHLAARRGRARRQGRPRGGRAVRPAHPRRVLPADPAGPGDRRPVPAAGGRHPARARAGRRRVGRRRGGRPGAGGGRGRATSSSPWPARTGCGSSGMPSCSPPRSGTW